MYKFSGGNWDVFCGCVYSGDTRLALMDRENKDTTPTERDCNAKLMALAPQLLDALEIAYAELTRITKGNESHDAHCVSQLALGTCDELIKQIEKDNE